MRAIVGLGIGLLLGLGCIGCGIDSPIPPDPPLTPFTPDWSQTRHEAVTAAGASLLGPLSVEPGPTAGEDPPRAILLCNVDDDDEDGRPDLENAEIDSNADADDLARITVAPLAGSTGSRVELALAATQGETAAADGVRLFDAQGRPRLGRGHGATWVLDDDGRRSLESTALSLYAEGCAFAHRTELRLSRDGTLVGRVRLEVAPLQFAPPTGAVDAIWICQDDENTNTQPLYAEFLKACALAVPNADVGVVRSIDLSSDLYGRDFWIQDELEWGYTETPFAHLPVAIHMPRGRPLGAWVEDQLARDVGYVQPSAPPRYGEPQIGLAYGGNLEPGADPACQGTGCIYHGFEPGLRPLATDALDTLAELRAFLACCTTQHVVGLDSSWLYVGHVDELLTFVWSPAAPDRVTLLVASPGDGVWHLDQLARIGTTVPEAFGRRYWRLVGDAYTPDFTWKDFLEARVAAGAPTLEQYNLDLEKRIHGDPNDASNPGVIAPLLAALQTAAQVDGVAQPTIVKVPTFFHQPLSSFAGTSQGAASATRVKAVALLPNMVNLVTINGHLVIPHPLLERFQDALADHEALRDAFEVHWIPVFDFLHRKGGGIHCATNTRHARPASPRWWEGGP